MLRFVKSKAAHTLHSCAAVVSESSSLISSFIPFHSHESKLLRILLIKSESFVMSTPPTKKSPFAQDESSFTQDELAYPSQVPASMTQMTQGSIETSDISHDGSNPKEDETALITPGPPPKKQITLTQYTRSVAKKRKKDVREMMNEEVEEDDDVAFIKTGDQVKGNCIHCHSNPCHDIIFGEFCAEDTRNYIRTGWYTESRVYNYFVASYKGAKKYRQWTKTGGVSVKFDMNPSIPACLFNASYSGIVEELRDDALRESLGKKRD